MKLLDIDPTQVALSEIPTTLAALAALQTALLTRLMTAPVPPAAPPIVDRMLTVREVAERLRCSVKSVYRRVDTFPFARRNGGRGWIFSEQGLTKWLARQRV